jgi:hypothetical protein
VYRRPEQAYRHIQDGLQVCLSVAAEEEAAHLPLDAGAERGSVVGRHLVADPEANGALVIDPPGVPYSQENTTGNNGRLFAALEANHLSMRRALFRYVPGYMCKGETGSSAYAAIFKTMVDAASADTSVKTLGWCGACSAGTDVTCKLCR